MNINYSIIRKNYIWALSPCILGYNIFKEMLNVWTNRFIINDIKDPENCIGRCYIDKKYQTNTISMLILYIYQSNVDYFVVESPTMVIFV